MRKNKLIVLLMLAVVMAFSFAFTACNTDSEDSLGHVCGHICTVCGNCLDENCDDEACWDKCEAATLEKAAEKIKNDLNSLEKTSADMTLANATSIRDVGHTDTTISYTVSWRIEVAEDVETAPASIVVADDGSVTLKVNALDKENHPYTLIATVSDSEENTKEVSFNLIVPSIGKLTVAEFIAKETGDTLYEIEGWVTAVNKIGEKGSFVLEDSTGAIFSYKNFNVTLGAKYVVYGTRDVNYDLPQLGTTEVIMLESTETFTPPLATELSADYLTENPITKENVLTYSVKPLKITGSELRVNDSGYYGTYYKNGKQLLNLYMNSTIKATAAELKGNNVIVYGYLRGFSTSYYTIQVTAIEKAPAVEMTDAEKIAAAKEDLIVEDIFDVGSVELPTADDDVNIAWSLAETTYATLSDNTLTVAGLPDADKTITLTATLSIGEITDTKTITVNIKLAKSKYLADVVATPAVGTAYKLAMWQNSDKKVYYAVKAVSGRFISTTTDVTEAVDVTLEAATGGYYVKLGDKYLTIVGEKYNDKLSTSSPTLADTATTVFAIRDDGVLTFVASLTGFDDATFYLGTHGSFNTIGSNAISYISDATKIDDTKYVARLVNGTKINADETPSGGDSGSTGGDSGSTGGTTTPTITPSTDKTAAYTFTGTTTAKGTLLKNDTALTLFGNSTTSDALVSVAVMNIYEGNGQGGAYENQSGFLKTGTSKAAGQLVLTFAEGKKATKVEIKCHDWYKSDAIHPTNSNSVAVNDSDAVLAPYNTEGTPAVLTFELDGTSNVVTLDFTNRVFIFEIIVTFA